jgi:lipid II:glycine glycyltransferase (peptidoglycan interpeptide bridge formation enzyme)
MAEPVYQADVDIVSPAGWAALLECFEDSNLYQTWSYGAVRWGEGNLSHLVLRQGREVIGIAQLRIIRPPFLKCGIAYLRWGPLCQLRGSALEFESVRRMATALRAEYVVKRDLFLRLVPDAFANSERADVFHKAFSGVCKPSSNHIPSDRTFVLDLAPPLDEVRKKLDQKWRNQLNRAEKNSLTIVAGGSRSEYQQFLSLYQEMWDRKRFDTTVDVNEFARICEDLPARLKLRILVCLYQGVPVSSIVCSALGSTGIYLLGATTGNGLQAKAAYLLQWAMIKWLKENGFRYYDLGGIDPELNPGVYHFKSGLSGRDVTRIAPLESCESPLSSLLMKVADAARCGFGATARKLKRRLARSPAHGKQTPLPKLSEAS